MKNINEEDAIDIIDELIDFIMNTDLKTIAEVYTKYLEK